MDVSSFANHETSLGTDIRDNRIIRPGRNVWRTADADRFAVLIDGEDYFLQLADVLDKAERSIAILGWDFNPDIRLRPRLAGSPTIGETLRSLVEERPDLEICILVWGMGPVYSGKSLRMFGMMDWCDHPRIHLRFDFRHPLRASHHQKIVVVDDRTAFLGGIDLTARRWDSRDHAVENPLRQSPDGKPYGPVHDLQTIVTGDIARAIGDVTRRRWKRATGEVILPATDDTVADATAAASTPAPWPHGLDPLLSQTRAGIALTEPWKWRGHRGHREAIRLTHDALKSARRHLYVETQYLASFGVARTLARLLRKADGPEVVIIVTRESHGFLEKVMMGNNRNRLIRRLRRADRHGRLRVCYAVTPDGEGGEREIIVHSKLIIADDRFIRVGSSNLNYRSEGLDTECDIAVETDDPAARAAITTLRNDLLAEHLDADPAEVAARIAATGSMIAACDALNTKPRGLRAFDVDFTKGDVGSILGTGIVDPKQPYWPLPQIRGFLGRLASGRLLGRVFARRLP